MSLSIGRDLPEDRCEYFILGCHNPPQQLHVDSSYSLTPSNCSLIKTDDGRLSFSLAAI